MKSGVLLTRLITLTMRTDLVQVADRGVQRAQQVDRDRTRGLLAGGGVHVAAELADPGLAVALGDVAGDEDQVAGAHEGHVGGGRHGHRRQFDAEGLQLVVDGWTWQRSGLEEAQILHCAMGGTARSMAPWPAGLAWLLRRCAAAAAAPLWPLWAYRGLALGGVCCALGMALAGRLAAALLGAACAGLERVGWRAAMRLAEVLPAALEGQDLRSPAWSPACRSIGGGRAVSLRGRRGEPAGAAGRVPPRVSLGWYAAGMKTRR